MMEYVVLDREGRPVYIEDGRILEAPAPYVVGTDCEVEQVWNSEELCWEDPDPEDEPYWDEADESNADFYQRLQYWCEARPHDIRW